MSEAAIGSEIAGHRLDGVAGRGGMGVVYRATQLRLNRQVALKLIAADLAADPSFRERFEHESEIAAQIEHPHVIPLYEAGEQDGKHVLVPNHPFVSQKGETAEVRRKNYAESLAWYHAIIADAFNDNTALIHKG